MAVSTGNRVHGWRRCNPATFDGSSTYLKEVPMEDLLRYPDLSIIRYMDLSRNFLEILPDSFAPGLIQLEKLNLSSNFIRFLPANFGTLENLIILDCRDNEIRVLPSSFSKLTRLKWLDLTCNPLELPKLARGNDNDDNWNPEGCYKAAKEVVHVMRQLNKIREKERPRVTRPEEPVWMKYGQQRTRPTPKETVLPKVNAVGSNSGDKIKFVDETSASLELPETEVLNSVMKPETWDETLCMEKKPCSRTILYGILCGFCFSLLLVVCVELELIDHYLDKYFSLFLSPSELDWVSYVLYILQYVVTTAFPDLPLIKAPKAGFWNQFCSFFIYNLKHFMNYFVSPHNLPY